MIWTQWRSVERFQAGLNKYCFTIVFFVSKSILACLTKSKNPYFFFFCAFRT